MRIANINARNLEGKRLAKTIYSSEGRILLRKGQRLTSSYLALLKSKGFTSIYIENELLPDLSIDESINESTRVEATAQVKKTLEGVKYNRELEMEAVNRAVDAILEDLIYNSEMVVQLSTLRSIDDYSFVHSVNVCILSMLIGQAMHYPYRDLKHLGVGAILHDLGKIRIPQEVLQRAGPLAASEYEQVKNHTREGFEILRKNREVSILSAHIAFQHHERLDGSGYPRGLGGQDILEFARITAVADVYDALVSDRPYREKSFLPGEALQELKRGASGLFDPNCVGHLMSRLAVYPVGTIVLLTTQQIAVVSGQGAHPDRPLISVITDPEMELIKPHQISLEDELDAGIKRALPNYPPYVQRQIEGTHQDSFLAASGYWRT